MTSSQNARAREPGFSFAELMFGSVVIAVTSVVLISHLALNYNHLRTQRERVFAYMTAKSILAEIQAFATEGINSGKNDIDSLDDGARTVPTLSIARAAGNLVAPDHELSGNSKRGSDWVWSRQVSVRPLPGVDNAKMRYVTVRIFKLARDGKKREIANLSGMVHSLAQSFPPTQVFDVFLLAIENIPGWWVHMETIRPFVETMITDLERTNPGLTLRTHWITKASYGRDPLYRPYINESNDSQAEPGGVYYYPGRMPTGNASTFYYVPGMIRARMQSEAGELNGHDATLNPFPYALADWFNHGMRYPQELAYHEKRVAAVDARRAAIAAAIASGSTPPDPLWDMSAEPTYRLLLEDMCTNPDRYRNALVMNLHGELMPMPSIRNYSDAAKSPRDYPGVRVVTHPEELRTLRDPVGSAHDDAVFRVYAYTTDPDNYKGPQVLDSTAPILLQVMGVNLAASAGDGTFVPGVTIECLAGGVGGTDYVPFTAAPSYGAVTDKSEMYYEAEFVDPGPGKEKYTLVTLANTPVVAPLVNNSVSGLAQGLDASSTARLYGMEYVPSCTGTTADFAHTLASAGTGPKNSARWRLRIPGAVLENSRFVKVDGTTYNPAGDVRLTVRTRIKSEVDGPWNLTGTVYPTPNNPYDLSETYTWWADSPTDVPFTERSQFTGDPRYNPYKDLLDGDPDFPSGYNWCFDSLQNGTDVTGDFAGLDKNRLRNLWQGYLRQDVPRYFEMLRTALVRTGSVYNTLTGWSYYYMGHGAEIGYDASNGYPNSIPTNLTAFGNNGATGYVNNITGNRLYVRSSDTNYWWGKPWLGETFPDAYYGQWLSSGNLTPGVGTDKFYQAVDQNVYAGSSSLTAGTVLQSAIQRLKSTGCAMFFNIGDSTKTFNHKSASGSGSLVAAGLELASNYHMDVPATTTINRPFALDTSNSPDGWDLDPYLSNRLSATLIQSYFTSPTSGYTGSGLVQLTSPDGKSSAFIVVNGLAQTTALGTKMLAQYSLLTMLHSFFESGASTLVNRISMPPRVEILHPTETMEIKAPLSIDLKFDATWKRWDGAKYTTGTSDTFAENESDIQYFPLYSRNNGATWQSMLDDAPVRAGRRPAGAFHLLDDSTAGPETHSWATPAAQFPMGSYVIRIEVYRKNGALHYSYDQKKIFIER